MSGTLLGYLLSAAALLLFTTAILVTKLASSRLSLGLGFLVATATNVGFSALALAVQLALRPGGLGWNAQAFWLFTAAGAFATYLGRWFFYESVVRFGPAKASIFQVSSPLFTALMAWLLLDERLTPRIASGMALTVAGLVLVSCKPGLFSRRKASAVQAAVPPATFTLHQRLLQSALLLGLGSSLAYAIGNVLRGSAVRLWNEPILGALVGAVCGLVLHLSFSSGKRQAATGGASAGSQPKRSVAVCLDRRRDDLRPNVHDWRHALHPAVGGHAGHAVHAPTGVSAQPLAVQAAGRDHGHAAGGQRPNLHISRYPRNELV